MLLQILQGMLQNIRAPSYPAGEGLATFVAHKGSGDKIGIMVTLEVHVQKLLLPEGFLALAAGKWLLPCVCALVHYHMAFLQGKRPN